jgi:hypothetical protein
MAEVVEEAAGTDLADPALRGRRVGGLTCSSKSHCKLFQGLAALLRSIILIEGVEPANFRTALGLTTPPTFWTPSLTSDRQALLAIN